MSANLANLYAQQYSTNVALLLQQKQSKLRMAVTEGSYQGEQASPVDQIGSVEMTEVTTRYEPKTRTDVATDRRWVIPTAYDLQQIIDTFDKLKMISDPKSPYVQTAVAAANRRFDRYIISGLFGTAKTGKTGSTDTAFATSTQTVGVNVGGTASNLNVAKIKQAIEIALSNEIDIDEDPLFMAITAKQNTALLNEIQVISSDFKQQEAPVVSNGRVMSFLGVNFIHSQLLGTGTDDQSGTSRAIPLWCKSGMHLGIWQDTKYDVREAKELKGNPWEVYLYLMAGATRVEEKKVVRIWARES